MFAGGVDTSATETKGTVLIQSAEQVVIYALVFAILLIQVVIMLFFGLLFTCSGSNIYLTLFCSLLSQHFVSFLSLLW